MGQLLPNMDREIAQNLKMILKRTGDVDVHINSSVTKIEKSSDGARCLFNEKNSNREKEVTSDMILVAVGRKPYTDRLLSSKTSGAPQNIISENGFIKVNEYFETPASGIYAIGDVTGGIQLAHVATAAGKCAISHMNGLEPAICMDTVPSCVYTEPEIASVGLTLTQARDRGIDAVSQKYTMGANGKSILSLVERGFVNLTDRKSVV